MDPRTPTFEPSAVSILRTMTATASFALSLLVLGACTRDHPGSPEPGAAAEVPAVVPDINGRVTEIRFGSGRHLVSALVEQPPEISSGSPRDYVNVTRDTRIFRETTTGLAAASIAEVRVGVRVKAWYTAYVAAPFPRRMEARALLLSR